MRQLVCIAALLALAACATPSPFSAITLGGEPTVTSTKRAAFSLVSGVVTSEIRGLAFSERDQSEFVEVLAKELLRLKVFQAVSTGHTKELPDFKVTVTFAHTRYSRLFVLVGMGGHVYTLHAAIMIEGPKAPYHNEYWIDSSAGLSTWQLATMNAHETKAEAVRKLLEKLIPDIQTYVAGNA